LAIRLRRAILKSKEESEGFEDSSDPMSDIIGFGSLPSVSYEISDDPFPIVLFRYTHGRSVQAMLGRGRGQAAFPAVPCGSITNFLAAPLSKSLYPCGALSNEMMVALHALAG